MRRKKTSRYGRDIVSSSLPRSRRRLDEQLFPNLMREIRSSQRPIQNIKKSINLYHYKQEVKRKRQARSLQLEPLKLLDPRRLSSVCIARQVRLEVLHAKNIAGTSGISLGKRKNLSDSKVRC